MGFGEPCAVKVASTVLGRGQRKSTSNGNSPVAYSTLSLEVGKTMVKAIRLYGGGTVVEVLRVTKDSNGVNEYECATANYGYTLKYEQTELYRYDAETLSKMQELWKQRQELDRQWEAVKKTLKYLQVKDVV